MNSDFTPPSSLPAHYRDDESGFCDFGGTFQPDGLCPSGCSFAAHYSNDGHEECEDLPLPVADPMDEQAEQLAQQHRKQTAQQYDPDAHAAADSYARLTERVLEDQRRAQLAQINQAAQRRGR